MFGTTAYLMYSSRQKEANKGPPVVQERKGIFESLQSLYIKLVKNTEPDVNAQATTKQ